MQYKAVLFDLDGTLLDTLEDLATAANRALAAREFPVHPVDAYRYFVGDGLSILVERILPASQRTPEMVQKMVTAFQQEYVQNWNDRSAPYPGIAEMLDALTLEGVRMAVLSNKPDDFTRLCVKSLLPKWSFDPLLGQRPGVAKKPDPAAALEVAHSLHLSPKQILYVGDTSVDMQTARAAGMDAVGVLWGFRDKQELQQSGALHLIDTPAELLPILCHR